MSTSSEPNLFPSNEDDPNDPAYPVEGRGELQALVVAMVAVAILAAIGLFIGDATVTFIAGAVFLIAGGLYVLYVMGRMMSDTHDDDALLH